MSGLECEQVRVPASVRHVILYVSEHFSDDISLDDLAGAAGVSRFTLCRCFERCFGTTVMNWLWQVRVSLAKFFLDSAMGGRLTDIAVFCGFNSSAHFSRTFRKYFLKSPSQWLQLSNLEGSGDTFSLMPKDLQTHAARIALSCLSFRGQGGPVPLMKS